MSGDLATTNKEGLENPRLHSAHAREKRSQISPLEIPEVNRDWPKGNWRVTPSTWELQIEPGPPSHSAKEWPSGHTEPRPGPFEGQTTYKEEELTKQQRNIETDTTFIPTRNYGGTSLITAPSQEYMTQEYDQGPTRRTRPSPRDWQIYLLPGNMTRTNEQNWPETSLEGDDDVLGNGTEIARI
ncbi:hypothetical protein IW262DRAFT_1468457 [Armillaria fumosa]|nr:hypothetical protein IW262DRAFT_1468457 [Armillaria fumosa]